MPKGWKTISTQIREEEYKKAKALGINISEVLRKALREEIKRREEEKKLEAIKRLGELLEKTGATSEENIKIIREIREEN
ncbi:MAG: type II toxin-antitoxin system CcdA family antitoxin [Candidatus Nanopusillus acidilobi]